MAIDPPSWFSLSRSTFPMGPSFQPCSPAARLAATWPPKASCISMRAKSSRGHSGPAQRSEILNHHHTGASNGPTSGLNLVIKKVKRAGRGFRRFDHYRLLCLLHAGGSTRPAGGRRSGAW